MSCIQDKSVKKNQELEKHTESKSRKSSEKKNNSINKKVNQFCAEKPPMKKVKAS